MIGSGGSGTGVGGTDARIGGSFRIGRVVAHWFVPGASSRTGGKRVVAFWGGKRVVAFWKE